MNKKIPRFIVMLIVLIIVETSAFVFIIMAAQGNDSNKQQENNVSEVIAKDKTTQQDEDTRISYQSYDVPENSGFKSFMDYRTITDVSSKQYSLQSYYARTGNYGIRMVGDRYCGAIGSYFNVEIGQYFDIVLENGTVIPCIMADMKADVDTEAMNIITLHNGCMSEFVVDTPSLDSSAKLYGDISYCSEDWSGPIASIRVYQNNVFDFD